MLHNAAEKNDVEMVEFLLSHPRIDMDPKTYDGHTPLRLAQSRKHMHVVQLLILGGAEECDGEYSDDSTDEGEEEAIRRVELDVSI